jgi:hypothetical protein
MENDFPGDVGALGLNYLEVCDQADGKGASVENRAAQGIRSVMKSKLGEFTMEYLCDPPTQNMWFCMRVTRIDGPQGACGATGKGQDGQLTEKMLKAKHVLCCITYFMRLRK